MGKSYYVYSKGIIMKIWTDGSCHPNPGPGGWGYVTDAGTEAFGGEANTTNNRMEMMAILAALQSVPTGGDVTIHSDSMYCVNGLTKWNKSWARADWMRKGVAIPNRDLWVQLDQAKARVKATFSWVRGHAGDTGNVAADALANRGRLSLLEAEVPLEKIASPDCGCEGVLPWEDCEHTEAEADRLFRAAMGLDSGAYGATYSP